MAIHGCERVSVWRGDEVAYPAIAGYLHVNVEVGGRVGGRGDGGCKK